MADQSGSDPPSPPPGLSPSVRDALRGADPADLRLFADYAERLADWKAAAAADPDGSTAPDADSDGGADSGTGDGADAASTAPGSAAAGGVPDGWDPADWRAAAADVDAPPRATLTVKEINDNRYFYYQWREGDAVKSAYVAPVSPSR
ncbi:MAG: hypothetical protein ABEJ31_05495 [Haloarculaceae archaeon]